MKAIVVKDAGAKSKLELCEVEDLNCAPDEVLVQVHATALNRADLLQRAGKYPPPPGVTEILGLELAGEIVSTPSNSSAWKKGQRVCALVSGGGYAARAAVPERMLMLIPERWSFEQAAAMPEAFYTAYLNLFIEGGLKAGETVLIHGGGSGVGTAAIQLAKNSNCKVIVTVGSAEKAARCLELGADVAINYKTQDFVEEVRRSSAGKGANLILDCLGGSYLTRNIEALASCGRLMVISMMGGAESTLNLRPLLSRRLTIKGSVLRGRTLEEKSALRDEVVRELWPHFESGKIVPVIDSVFPIEQAEEAHQRMAASLHVGKIVLRW